MIRYVLIVVLATTTLGLTGVALDHASTERGEQAVRGEIAAIERAATSLFEFETATDASPPQRVIELRIPEPTMTTDGLETLRFERLQESEMTRVRYSVDGGIERKATIPVPIQHVDGGAVDLSNRTGTQRLVLALGRDRDGAPVVTISDY